MFWGDAHCKIAESDEEQQYGSGPPYLYQSQTLLAGATYAQPVDIHVTGSVPFVVKPLLFRPDGLELSLPALSSSSFRQLLKTDLFNRYHGLFWGFFGLYNTPLLSHPLPSHLLPLEVGPLNPDRGLGSGVSSPSGVWGGAPAEFWILMHFSLKIWHLVETVLMIFLRINWPNAFLDSTFFSVLDSTFFVLDSTFWLDSTLKIDPDRYSAPSEMLCDCVLYKCTIDIHIDIDSHEQNFLLQVGSNCSTVDAPYLVIVTGDTVKVNLEGRIVWKRLSVRQQCRMKKVLRETQTLHASCSK